MRIEEAALRAAITPAVAVEPMREAFRADGEGRTLVPAGDQPRCAAHRGRVPRQDGVHRGRAAHRGQDRERLLRQSGEGTAERIRTDGGLRRRDRACRRRCCSTTAFSPTSARAPPARSPRICSRRARSTSSACSDPACRRVIRCAACGSSARSPASSPGARHRRISTPTAHEMRQSGYDAVAAPSRKRSAARRTSSSRRRRRASRWSDAEWLRPGQHVTAVGSDSPGKQELAAAVSIARTSSSSIASRQCAAFGELRHALDAGPADADRRPRRARRDRRRTRTGPRRARIRSPIADLTGVGFQDTAIASTGDRTDRVDRGNPVTNSRCRASS